MRRGVRSGLAPVHVPIGMQVHPTPLACVPGDDCANEKSDYAAEEEPCSPAQGDDHDELLSALQHASRAGKATRRILSCTPQRARAVPPAVLSSPSSGAGSLKEECRAGIPISARTA